MIQPSPKDLGLPRKFVSFRERQWEAINDIVSAKERFIVQVRKTGAGKTLVGIGAAKYLNCRMMYLTATKGLQEQLMDDFEGIGLVSLTGKTNYTCILDPSKNCAEGAISRCLYCIKGRSSMCTWGGARQAVMDSRLSVTNYACWMAANKYGTGLGDYDLLIADEAHSISGELCKAQQIIITENEVINLLKFSWPEDTTEMSDWKVWAVKASRRAKYYSDELKAKMDKSKHPSSTMVSDFRHHTNLSRKLADLVLCREDQWIVDTHTYGYQFDPIYPWAAAERLLFRKIPKVVLTSGTIGPRITTTLGIQDEEAYYKEYVSEDVDADTSPFAYLPVINPATGQAIKVDRNTSPEEMLLVIDVIDRIIECWAGYKGIIHSVSFQLRDFIIQNSSYRRFMVTNYSGGEVTTADVIKKFKAMGAPAVLVSPSVLTGYDFPGPQCRYQIFPKVPFPDPRPKIEQARNGKDKHRYASLTMEKMEQGYGRADRGDGDWQITFVLDSHIQKFMWRYGFLAASWFLPKYKQIKQIIMPPI